MHLVPDDFEGQQSGNNAVSFANRLGHVQLDLCEGRLLLFDLSELTLLVLLLLFFRYCYSSQYAEALVKCAAYFCVPSVPGPGNRTRRLQRQVQQSKTKIKYGTCIGKGMLTATTPAAIGPIGPKAKRTPAPAAAPSPTPTTAAHFTI